MLRGALLYRVEVSENQRYGLLGSSDCCGSWEVEKRLLRERQYCGSVEIQRRLLRERILLRQGGNMEKAPAGADTAAAEIRRRLLQEWIVLRQGGNTEEAPVAV
ncbi:hypothetical protein ROHU_004060 [Labeo rohita]|uniref:Uncharacterized protein n=1 Tax=Labeo rohita TaxID=84645 RepID=A0A498NRH4_LABRO|nr:hypothetical protein ROHU_004060 [Labeo rohita]